MQVPIFNLGWSLVVHNILSHPLISVLPMTVILSESFFCLSRRYMITWYAALINMIRKRIWWPSVIQLHLCWRCYLLLLRMLGVSTEIIGTVLILIVSRLVETIWSEHDNLISAIVVWGRCCWMVRVLSMSGVSELSRIMSLSASFWWRLWELTHYWTVNQSLSDFTNCLRPIRVITLHSCLLPGPLMIEVLSSASIIWIV